MTLPVSGALSLSQIRTELGLSGPVSLSNPLMRTLSGIVGGGIPFSAMRGKSISGRRPGEVMYLDETVAHTLTYATDGKDAWVLEPDAANPNPDENVAIINGTSYQGGIMIQTWNPPLDWGDGLNFDYNTFGVMVTYNSGQPGSEGCPSSQQIIDNSGHLRVNDVILNRGAYRQDDKFSILLIRYDYPAGLAGFSGQRIHVGLLP